MNSEYENYLEGKYEVLHFQKSDNTYEANPSREAEPCHRSVERGLAGSLDERITVEECLNHKFLKPTSANSSFDDELEALGLRIEGIEILKQKELLYNNRDSISDTNSYIYI